MRAWTFQDHRQKQKLGDKSPWSVGWYDPDGRKRTKKIGSRSMAEKYRRKVEGELAAGTYRNESRKSWADFRAEYGEKIAAAMEPQNRRLADESLRHFERIIRPVKLAAIKTQTIDEYVAKRRVEPGRKGGSTVSPATINKDLRYIKSALRIAHEWGYLASVPRFRMVREPEKLPLYVTPEHFAAIYGACDAATMPKGLPYEPADWWRAFLTFSYMTGWRLTEPLSLFRDDVDLEAGTALSRYDDNKGKRDSLIRLHPVAVEHLRTLASFDPMVFPWPHHRRTLDVQYHKIQREAGIHLPCRENHDHTPTCHVYGFHDLRRAFATANAETLTADALQALMRHKSYTTTQRYINVARQVNQAVEQLFVPEVLKTAGG